MARDIPVYVKSSFDKRWEHPKLATRDDEYMLSDPKELCDWFADKKKNNSKNCYDMEWSITKTNYIINCMADLFKDRH